MRIASCFVVSVLAGCGSSGTLVDSGALDGSAQSSDAADVARGDAPSLDTASVDSAPASDTSVAPDDQAVGADVPAPRDVPALHDVAVDAPPAMYVATTRTLVSGGVTRSFVVATPSPARAMLPLVIALHGDGGNGPGMRTAFPIEAQTHGDAVVIYPTAPGGSFEYWTYEGRQREAQFTRDLIDDAVTHEAVDRTRVFLTGFSGGATMSNALGCILGAGVLRGVGINSGTLYPTNSVSSPSRADFAYTSNGGVDCANGLAATILVWGENDRTDVSFMNGQATRDNYLATNACGSGTDVFPPDPCVRYQGCTRAIAWCPIPGMAHALWPRAPEAIWRFWSTLP